MDPSLRALILEDMPPLNEKVAEGFAVSEIPKSEHYVRMLFESIQETFPPGLRFHGGKRCTPREQYMEMTRKQSQKSAKSAQRSTFDIAKSNVYMMKYEFSYNGKPLKPRYLYLPYVDDGGFITISDSRYTISPVLADRVISVMRKTIFVRLIKTRFNINRVSQHFIMDNVETFAHVVWSKIHQKKVIKDKNDPENVAAESTLAHYLFCKYGVVETFRIFGGAEVVVGDEDSITPEKYPPGEWSIGRTSRNENMGAPGGGNRRNENYRVTKLRLAVRCSQVNPMVHNLIGAFYYAADRFPQRLEHLTRYISPENATNPATARDNLGHEKRTWILLLGHLVAPSTVPGKVMKEMESHMRSLDEYIDPIVREQLKNIGYNVENVYQLFARMIEDFDPLLLANRKNLSSMYEKELNVLYFVLFDISKQIMELGFQMLKICEEVGTNPEKAAGLNVDKLNHVLGNKIRTGAIFHIYKSSGAVSANSYPGDNKLMKITLLLVPQQHTNKMNRKKGGLQLSDPINQMHISVVEFGGYQNLPKSQPSGHFRINPFAAITLDNVLLRNPAFIPMLDHAQSLIEK